MDHGCSNRVLKALQEHTHLQACLPQMDMSSQWPSRSASLRLRQSLHPLSPHTRLMLDPGFSHLEGRP